MSNDNVIKSFCIGMGMGVTVGILFAPKSGAASRKYLQDKTMGATGCIRNETADVLNAAADVADRGEKALRYQKENVIAAVEAGKAAWNEASAATPAL